MQKLYTVLISYLARRRCCIKVDVGTAAVDEQTDAGDEGGIWGGKEVHCLGTVLRLAYSPKRVDSLTTGCRRHGTQSGDAVKNGRPNGRWTVNKAQNEVV